MPKIRGVKPEFWTDEAVVDLTIPARILLIGLWNFACDNGHLQDKPKQIKMRVLPADDVNATELLRELEASGRITRADGWITIPNLTHHQKPDRRYFTTCDKSGCEDPPEKVYQRESRRVHAVHTPSAPGVHAGRTAGARAEGDGEGDGDLKVSGKPSSDKSDQTDDRFDEFWDTYDKKLGRKKAEVAYRAALKKPHVTPDLLIEAAGAYIAWQTAEGKHPEFTKNPLTWLHGEHWTDEIRGRAAPQTRVGQHMALVRQLADQEQQPTIPQIGSSR